LSNGPGQTLKAAARKIVALVNETEGGVSRETLLATAQSLFPRLSAQVVTALVAEGLAAGALVEADGVLRVLGDEPQPLPARPLPVRDGAEFGFIARWQSFNGSCVRVSAYARIGVRTVGCSRPV
jgi:hypothetical protein